MERLGKSYLLKKQLAPGIDPIAYEAAQRQIPGFNILYQKMDLFKKTIGFVSFDGVHQDLAATCKHIVAKLELHGACLIGLNNPDLISPGHLVALIRHESPEPYIEAFDSTGFNKYRNATGADMTWNGIGNFIALTKFIGTIPGVPTIYPDQLPLKWSRTQSQILQVGENPTCAFHCIFRVMNRELSPQEYYETLFQQARGANYDAYVMQMVNEMFDAMRKVISGKTYEIDFLEQKPLSFSTLLKAFRGNVEQVRDIREKEAEYYGEEWADRQERLDALDFQTYYEWAMMQKQRAQTLARTGIIDEFDLAALLHQANHAQAIYNGFVETNIMKEAFERRYEDIEDERKFQIEKEQERAANIRAAELEALVPGASPAQAPT